MAFDGFRRSLIDFLEQLANHNERPWFDANRDRYEREVLVPCMEFIRAFQPRLKRISPFFVASDRRVGGSLMRVYRDTRFAKDKTPYKTNVGIQFRHEHGRDVHAPGFYVHIAPEECFLALGLWRPDRETLAAVRQHLLQWPDKWRRACRKKESCDQFELEGESLKRPPRGFPADHPLLADLMRTDYIAVANLKEKDILARDFADRVAGGFAASRPFMRFLCDALKMPF
jgi:uncharacterized protein (TIGR02453 family)